MLTKKFASIAICFLIAGSAFAQQDSPVPAETSTTVASDVLKVMLDEEGALVGNAFVADSDDEAAANVKVSLSADGKVVDTVEANEDGNFVFANVAPGVYQVLGSGDGLIGSQSIDISGFSSAPIAAPSPCSLGMCGATSEVVYDTCGAAPVETFSAAPCSACNACNTCGGGLGGGGIGGRLGGGLGGGGRGGFFSRPGRLLAVGGLIGGLAAIDGDDASPDQ